MNYFNSVQEPLGLDAVQVQRAGVDDAAALERIDQLCFGKGWPLEEYLAEIARADAEVLTVRASGCAEPVAWLDARVVADEVHLYRVATHPLHQRQGHARRLLLALIQSAAERDAHSILLEVAAGNAGAIALYRSLDFVETGCRPGYYANGESALLMDRAIRASAR